MADDLEGEEDERTVELASLAAIYPELVLDEPGSDPFSATISIEVEPVEPLSIRFPSADGAPPVGPLTPPHSVIEKISQLEIEENGVAPPTNEDVYRISHLPALNLRLSLPEGYPAEKPPVFYLESQYSWLPEQKLQELREAGHSLWEELGRDQVVFSYIDHLREAAERGFDMAQADDQVLELSPDLKVSLLDFDLNAKRAKFERETFECGICLGKPCEGDLADDWLITWAQMLRKEPFVTAFYSAGTSFASRVSKTITTPALLKVISEASSVSRLTVAKNLE